MQQLLCRMRIGLPIQPLGVQVLHQWAVLQLKGAATVRIPYEAQLPRESEFRHDFLPISKWTEADAMLCHALL